MTTPRDQLSKPDAVTITAIEETVLTLVEARTLMEHFHVMVRQKSGDLDSWITGAATSLLASFAASIGRKKAAVTAAINSPWCNGQAEGQIAKLKLVKRQMHGRAMIDLLKARLLLLDAA